MTAHSKTQEWHGGKGSQPRATQVSRKEASLRDQLWREKDPAKKKQIKLELEEFIKGSE